MRLLLVDAYGGDGMLDYALRCIEDGHDVRWYFNRTEKTLSIGKGLVEVVKDWREWMRWADLVILSDNTKYLREIDAWRKNRGTPVVGATRDAAAWELNRTLGQKVLKRAGIPVLPYKEFSDYDAAIAYVKREMCRFVSKPIGDEPDKALSYVAKSPADLVYMLERWKKAQKLKGSFMLQEFVAGCEMAVGGWFGPGGFLPGWCENWEFKSLMAGDRGPNTGEMGTVLRYVARSKLADKVLKPLEEHLHRVGYCGYVDVNCIIDEHGDPWPLEFTMRFGWPTFNIQQALHEGDHAQWLADLCEGKNRQPPRQLQKVCVGVVLALPDFPYSHATRKEVTGIPIYGLKPSLMKNVHPCQTMLGTAPVQIGDKIVTAPSMVTAGDYVLVATGTGDTVSSARSAAHRVLEKISLPASPFWRPDIGARLKKQLPQVQAKGYATGMSY